MYINYKVIEPQSTNTVLQLLTLLMIVKSSLISPPTKKFQILIIVLHNKKSFTILSQVMRTVTTFLNKNCTLNLI